MGGSSSRSSNNNSNNKKKNKSTSLFVDGGILNDWRDESIPKTGKSPNQLGISRSANTCQAKASSSDSKEKTKKPFSNQFGYTYQSVHVQVSCFEPCVDKDLKETGASPIASVDSEKTPIMACEDRTPLSEPICQDFSYNFASNLVLGESCHRGLGFCEEIKEEGAVEEELGQRLGFSKSFYDVEDNTLTNNDASFNKNNGFLSIGGLKLYTEDVSNSDEENELTAGGSVDDDSGEDSIDDGRSESDEIAGDDDSLGSSNSNNPYLTFTEEPYVPRGFNDELNYLIMKCARHEERQTLVGNILVESLNNVHLNNDLYRALIQMACNILQTPLNIGPPPTMPTPSEGDIFIPHRVMPKIQNSRRRQWHQQPEEQGDQEHERRDDQDEGEVIRMGQVGLEAGPSGTAYFDECQDPDLVHPSTQASEPSITQVPTGDARARA